MWTCSWPVCSLWCRQYKGVSKSFRIGRLERELQMLKLSVARCSCIAILWVSLASFAAITICVASQRVFIFVYFVIDSVRKLLDTPSYSPQNFSIQKFLVPSGNPSSDVQILIGRFYWLRYIPLSQIGRESTQSITTTICTVWIPFVRSGSRIRSNHLFIGLPVFLFPCGRYSKALLGIR
jgi:hypothetical protein